VRTTRLRQPDGSRWGSQRIRPSAPSASFARRHRLYTRYTATGRRSSPTCCAHSRGECILFIWGPNFEMLPAAHRTLGSTQPLAGQTLKNEPAEVRGSCTGWREQNLALCCQRLVRRASLAVLDTLRPVGVASPHAVLTPWGNASSLSGGRILKCFPPPIALSAARNRWRAKLSATGRRSSPHAPHSIGNSSSLSGAEFWRVWVGSNSSDIERHNIPIFPANLKFLYIISVVAGIEN